MTYLILALVLTITGCGSDDSAGPATESSVEVSRMDNDDPEATSVAKGSVTALMVEDASKAPICDRDGLLIYVLDVKEFRVCHNPEWVVVDIKGPKGDKGDPGEVTVAQQQQQTVVAPPALAWVDTMGGFWWLHAGESHNYASGCMGDWRQPTAVEIRNAVTRGLVSAFQALGYTTTEYWLPGTVSGDNAQVHTYAWYKSWTPKGLLCVRAAP
jgi:hypothetical protein